MANTPNENLMSELASQMIAHIGSFFERINASSNKPVENFAEENAQNFLYVLYAANGLPLFAGVMTESGGKREAARAQKEVQALAVGGYVESYRTVDFGSENMAVQMERLVSDLFGAALPLSAGSRRESAPEPTVRRRGRAARAAAEDVAVPKKRRARRAKSTSGKSTRRPGRPKKVVAADETPVRRPGRPRKVVAEAAAPARRPGRPRKNAVAEEAAAAPRRPGRPRKNAAAEETTAAPRKPGRPRKNAVAEETTAAPRKPGRPRKEGSTRATRSASGSRKGGRPRRTREVSVENEGA